MMDKIRIESPKRNTGKTREHFVYQTEIHKPTIEDMARLGITPDKYPRAVDLAAGNGGFAAKILLPQRWQPGNITNIDIAEPYPNLSPGTNWLYLDLEHLGAALLSERELPPAVARERGNYDFASMASAFEINNYTDCLADFFLRKNGIIWTSLGVERLFSPRKGVWKNIGSFLFEKQ